MMSHIFTFLFGLMMGGGICLVTLTFLPWEAISSLIQRDSANLIVGGIVIATSIIGLFDVYKHAPKPERNSK